MSSERRFRLSIGHKLMLMIALLTTGVIGCLATYWTSQQIDRMTSDLRRKAGTYGTLVSRQASSAVAFSDRATAEEVLSSLKVDDEIASIVLFGTEHEVLYSHGDPSPWVSRVGDTEATVVHTVGRISAITPVRSLEGPRGMLIIQLSTNGLDSARTRVRVLALGTGLAAFFFSILVAWLISRRLSRRLGALADAAKAVAAGDLNGKVIVDRSSDEIGVVAGSFNEMVSQLRHLIVRLRHVSKRERERLEGLVVARTAQLDLRNAQMRLIFDHVEQGFLTVDETGLISSERSAVVERWLGPIPEAGTFVDYVRSFAPEAADWFDMSWDSIRDGVLPVEICLAQLPSRFEVGGRRLLMVFRPLTDDGGRLRVLVMISDETAVAERERAERDERETTALVSRLVDDRAGFVAFFAESEDYVSTISRGQRGPGLLRAIHTLKGICAIEGVTSIADLCHELESVIAESDETAVRGGCLEIVNRWQTLAGKLAPFVDVATNQVALSQGEVDRLEAAIAARVSHGQLASLVQAWRCDRVAPRLERFADQARVLAGQLCKDPIEVRVDVDPDLRLPLERWSPFWATFVHALRNAIDHGVESASERALAGKPAAAVLVLRARQTASHIEIELEDQGRGISGTEWPSQRA